ncbi:MAG: hypothetical protein IKW90_05315 [Lachnospiraceae bacterium]|nr:hypothetical protein [Lachnospiraceae bacterium]
MKVEGQKILLGAVVIAAILVFVSYQFLYKPNAEKAETIENENRSLQERLNELNTKMASRSLYQEKIDLAEDMCESIFEKYGPGITPEKTIKTVIDLCHKVGCTIDSISFSDATVIYVSEEKDENEVPKRQLITSPSNITIESGYTQLKKIVDFINGYPERMNIESFNVSYNQQNGRLRTVMTINLYAVLDENHVYVDPVFEDIELGIGNVFKNYEPSLVEEQDEMGEENTFNPVINQSENISNENTEDNSSEE